MRTAPLALAGLLALAACSQGATPPAAAPASATASASAGAPAPVTVGIASYAFSPATLAVPAGTVVTFAERDPDLEGEGAHSVVADDGSFDSGGRIADGRTYATQPLRGGTYTYHCGIHSYMTGRLTVG